MPDTVASQDSEPHALYAQTLAARSRSRVLALRLQSTRNQIHETVQRAQDTRSRTAQIRQLWRDLVSARVGERA
jgi:hypothetical protein